MKKGIIIREEITVTKLISAFYYNFPMDFAYKGEKHASWEFVFVESGKVEVRADDTTYILKKHEMVFHKPNEFHSVKPIIENSSVIVVSFECTGAEMKYFNDKILLISHRQKLYLNDIIKHAEKLLLPKAPLDIVRDRAMERSPDASLIDEQFIKNSLELLLISLMESDMTKRERRIELYEQFKHRDFLSKEICEFLIENLNKRIKIEDIAERFSYSPSTIKRIFKEETGECVIGYFNKLKIKKAKELLYDTNLSINDISANLGYENIYYFSNFFKSKVGISPRAFRNGKM